MPSNPEQPNPVKTVPNEWKSLINDEVLDLEGRPTDEYLESRAGQKALEEEQKLYHHAEMIDQRIAEFDRILASESSTAKERAHAEKYRQKYLDLKDELLDKTINAIDGYRQEYAEGRGGEDIEALWSKLEYMERGDKAIDSAKSGAAATPSQVNSEPAPVNPEPQPAPEPQPIPEPKAPENNPSLASSPELQTTLDRLEDLHKHGVLSDEFHEQARAKIEAALKTISEIDQAHEASRQVLAANRNSTVGSTIEDEKHANIQHSIDVRFAQQAAAEAAAAAAAEVAADAAAEVEADAAAEVAADAAAETEQAEAQAREDTEAIKAAVGDTEKANVAAERLEKAKKKKGFKAWVAGVAAAGITIVLAAIIGLSGPVMNIFGRGNSTDTADPTRMGQTNNGWDSYDDYAADRDQSGAETREQLGIHDGYGETGMWLSSEKSGPFAFGAVQEVAPLFDNDECGVVNYFAHNQVESFADYLANLPEELQPEQFRGKTILETEAMLEELSDEEYTSLEKNFQGIIDQAFTRRVIVNGNYDNAYMRLIDETKPATHDNMELVRCTTTESNLEVTEFYWLDKDGNEIGAMQVKLIPIYDAEGRIVGYEGCAQVIKKEGSKTHSDLRSVPNNPSDPGNPNPDTGDEGTGSEGTGSEDTGSEDTGSEDTGSEDTGSEGTGSEDTGSEGTGSEDTGTEGTGAEGTGSEDTGSEGTGTEGTGTEGTGTEGTGEEGTGSEGTGTEGTEWGKSGDPHGGDLVDVSDLVDPNSEVTQEQNDATNQGNQGYIDDNHAQPGSPSENNGTGDNGFSQIIADGADTDGGRLSGGESQDTSGTNGTNVHTPSSQDIQRDNAGNDAQAAAQTGGGESGTGAVAGGDNFSDVAEEQAIANGDF